MLGPTRRGRRRHAIACAILLTRAPLLSVRDTLNNLILKSPQSWRERRPLEPALPASAHLSHLLVRAETSVGLPFFQIQGTVRSRLVMMIRAFVC